MQLSNQLACIPLDHLRFSHATALNKGTQANELPPQATELPATLSTDHESARRSEGHFIPHRAIRQANCPAHPVVRDMLHPFRPPQAVPPLHPPQRDTEA